MIFGRSRHHNHHSTTSSTHHHRGRRGMFGGFRKDPDRVAGGYKAALSNPNTTREGRRHAKWELRRMGRGNEAHVPFMTKVKRMFGIRSSPRSRRTHVTTTTHRRTRRHAY